MGGGASRPEGGGFRIFKLCPESPAAVAGLEVFFDYIVQIDDVDFLNETGETHNSFFSIVRNSVDKNIKLVVFNARRRDVRDVWIMPSEWGGPGLLGATVKYDLLEHAFTQGVRVLEVNENSPAHVAGLQPYEDYLLSTDEMVFGDLEDLVEFVREFKHTRVKLNVYNKTSNSVRSVELTPDDAWGGSGCIGCDIGTGYLHKIPATPVEKGAENFREEAAAGSAREDKLASAGGSPGRSPAALLVAADGGDSAAYPPPAADSRLLVSKIHEQLRVSQQIVAGPRVSVGEQTQEAAPAAEPRSAPAKEGVAPPPQTEEPADHENRFSLPTDVYGHPTLFVQPPRPGVVYPYVENSASS